MLVRDCMNRQVVSVSPEENVAVASRLMARYNVGALPVRAIDGSLCGMITDRDVILRCVALEKNPGQTTVGHIMSNHVISVEPETGLCQAAKQMARAQIRRLPVVEGRKLVGMVTLGDLSHWEDFAMEAAETLSEITSGISAR